MRSYTNWNASLFLKNVEKDRLYLNQEAPEPSRAFRPINTWEVPIGTPRVLIGPLGCQARVQVLIQFGLLF